MDIHTHTHRHAHTHTRHTHDTDTQTHTRTVLQQLEVFKQPGSLNQHGDLRHREVILRTAKKSIIIPKIAD